MFGFFEFFAAALVGFYALIPNYGLAIILLTLGVRLVLLPLSIKQTRSMKEMQRIGPEVKKIQQKYKGNRQKMNEEVMALYKEHGVNPFGGCAPMLLQLPVLFGLFYVIREPLKYMEPFRGSVLFERLSDAATALRLNEWLGFRLDCSASAAFDANEKGTKLLPDFDCGDGFVSAIPYVVLLLLMGASTWYQQKQMQGQRGPTSDQQQQQMQMMGRIMPVMLVVFGIQFPAGVLVYWLTTNAWTILQQRVMLGVTDTGTATKTKDGKAAGKPLAKPSSGKPATGRPDRSAEKPPQARARSGSSKKKKKR